MKDQEAFREVWPVALPAPNRRAAESSGQVFLPFSIFLEKADVMFDLNHGISGFLKTERQVVLNLFGKTQWVAVDCLTGESHNVEQLPFEIGAGGGVDLKLDGQGVA